MNEIIAGSLSLVGVLVVNFTGILVSSRLIAYRIEQLEKKVEKHNNFIERMYHVEDSAKSAHHRIDRLEK